MNIKGSGNEITKDDIDKLCIKNTEAVIFDLTDCLGKRNQKKQAFDILNNLIYQKQPLQLILIMLYRHFKNLFLVKVCMQENKDIMANVPSIKMPFLVKKYKEQASKFSIDELANILAKMYDLDIKSKTGFIDLEIGLDLVLCQI